jgi:hypothetical protein
MPGIPFVSENSSDADWGNLRFVSTTVLDTLNLRRTCDSLLREHSSMKPGSIQIV